MVDGQTKENESGAHGGKIDRAQLERRKRELQRVKFESQKVIRKERRIVTDADREIGEIEKTLRRAPNADA
jgi:hypothetical protein